MPDEVAFFIGFLVQIAVVVVLPQMNVVQSVGPLAAQIASVVLVTGNIAFLVAFLLQVGFGVGLVVVTECQFTPDL